jgi:hypothetical protein
MARKLHGLSYEIQSVGFAIKIHGFFFFQVVSTNLLSLAFCLILILQTNASPRSIEFVYGAGSFVLTQLTSSASREDHSTARPYLLVSILAVCLTKFMRPLQSKAFLVEDITFPTTVSVI